MRTFNWMAMMSGDHSEGLRSPRVDILHNIDPIYTKSEKTALGLQAFGIWNTAIQSAIRVQHWKLLTGNPGYSDWVPLSLSATWGRRCCEADYLVNGQKRVAVQHCSRPLRESGPFPQVSRDRKAAPSGGSQFNKTAVPVRYPPKTPSNPRLNGGLQGHGIKRKAKQKPSKRRLRKSRKKGKARKKQKKERSFPNCHSGISRG